VSTWKYQRHNGVYRLGNRWRIWSRPWMPRSRRFALLRGDMGPVLATCFCSSLRAAKAEARRLDREQRRAGQ